MAIAIDSLERGESHEAEVTQLELTPEALVVFVALADRAKTDQKFYNQGVRDIASGKKETPEAIGHAAYWAFRLPRPSTKVPHY